MAEIANITFACQDPAALAGFWAAALGYQIQEAPPGFMEALLEQGEDPNSAAAAVDPAGRSPRLFFLKMKKRPEVPGTSIPIHLDIHTPDREAEVKRLQELGATVVETRTRTVGPYSETWTVMRDPEGNGFCVQ